MGAHRYWRLYLPPINIGNGTHLSDVEVRGSIGGASLAGGATITSNYTAGQVAPYFDGNTGTSFYAQSSGAASQALWLAFEFATATTIAEVYLRVATGTLAPELLRIDYRDSDTTPWLPAAPVLIIGTTANGATLTYSGWSEPGSAGVLFDGLLRATTGSAQVAPKVTPFHHVLVRDVYHGGLGKILGTVKNKGTPDYAVYRRVRLLRERDGVFVRETWSDPLTGAYEFDGIDPNERYTALSYDHTHNFRAVVADNLAPEAM